MKKQSIIKTTFLFGAIVSFINCSNKGYVPNHELVNDSLITYQANLSEVYQEIDNFGASDAWTFQYVGKNWPEAKRNKIADLLFSREVDENGKPKGIGLSLWRMNFGAGSRDKPHPQIQEGWATTSCIRDEDGNYDLSENGVFGGQIWMAKAAKERGCEQFLGFCNSAPYYWTYSGYTTAIGTQWVNELNLKPEYIDDFAVYLSTIISGLKSQHGIDIKYVCPVNEPEWEADGTESCHATNEDISTIARTINKQFLDDGITTKIVVPESGKPQFVYGDDTALPNYASLGFKAKNFFSEESSCYIGDLSNVAHLLAAHSYWSVDTQNQLKQIRQQVGEAVNKYGIKYWQTEFCILSDDYDLGTTSEGKPMGGSGSDVTMKLALYVARIIHSDLVFANASAWHWWLGATPYEYKDGLIYLTENEYDGDIRESKLLWAFGNYSRFISPGAVRLGITSKVDVSDLQGLMCSCYKNPDGKLVYVIINFAEKESSISLKADDGKNRDFIPYITSDINGDDLRPMESVQSGEEIIMPAKSIITFVEK